MVLVIIGDVVHGVVPKLLAPETGKRGREDENEEDDGRDVKSQKTPPCTPPPPLDAPGVHPVYPVSHAVYPVSHEMLDAALRKVIELRKKIADIEVPPTLHESPTPTQPRSPHPNTDPKPLDCRFKNKRS